MIINIMIAYIKIANKTQPAADGEVAFACEIEITNNIHATASVNIAAPNAMIPIQYQLL